MNYNYPSLFIDVVRLFLGEKYYISVLEWRHIGFNFIIIITESL